MNTRIRVKMKPVNTIIVRLGVGKSGDVQRFVTHEVNRRITRYMPYRSSALSTKLKVISEPAEITVLGPYARYQYYGKVMVGPAPKRATDRDLDYSQSRNHNPLTGPFWDKHMMTAEGRQIAADVQRYVDRKKGRQ